METTERYSARNTIHALICTMRKHRRIFDTIRARTGLGRAAHRMLMILAEHASEYSQARLAERIEISPAAVAVMLKKLEADGYILRSASPTDSRLNTTELTEKGHGVVAESQRTFEAIDDAVFSGFSETEMETLNNFLQRMQKNIDALEARKDDAN